MSELIIDSGINEEAFPEPRLVKVNIIKQITLLSSRLDDLRNELPYGILKIEKKKLFCNALMGLFELLLPKLSRKWYVKKYKKYRKTRELEEFQSNSFKLTEKDMRELINYKTLLVDFVEQIGITKIEVAKEQGDMWRK